MQKNSAALTLNMAMLARQAAINSTQNHAVQAAQAAQAVQNQLNQSNRLDRKHYFPLHWQNYVDRMPTSESSKSSEGKVITVISSLILL